MGQLDGIKGVYSRGVVPIVQGFNKVLSQFLPGKEELVIIMIALAIGYKIKDKQYVKGGYSYWAKVSLIAYLILKILGFGISPWSLIKV